MKNEVKKPIYKRIWFWLIICFLGLSFAGNVNKDNQLSNSQLSSKSEIPTFKIGWTKYYDYGKYIDIESLSKIKFGEVVSSEIYTDKGTPCYSGRAWFYNNSENDQIMVLYSVEDPYRISEIHYVYNRRIWSTSPLLSSERIITVNRWKYEHYALFNNLEFDNSINTSENIIFEDNVPNKKEMLINKGFSNQVSEILSTYSKKFFIEEASVSMATRSNGEEYYSLHYGISTEMNITYYNGEINFYDDNSSRYIIKDNILINEYVFSQELNSAKSYIEEVVKLKSIDYLKNPTNTDLDYFNKYTRLSNNKFKYSGDIGNESFEMHFKYDIYDKRWIFYKYILNENDYSLIL